MFPFENSGDELKYDDYGAFLQPGTFRQAEGLGPGEAGNITACIPSMQSLYNR